MTQYGKETIQLINCGRQDCSDLHSWGPGMRPCYVIHYIIRGAGWFECRQKKYRLKAGESFLFSPYDTVLYYPDPTDPWEYTWVDFTGKEAPELLKDSLFTPENPVCAFLPPSRILPFYEALENLDIYREHARQANGILLTLLGIYADAYPALPAEEDGEKARLNAALMLIRANYHHSSFHVETLCRMLPANRVTLYRCFQRSLGVSPNQYLTDYRISQARRILRQGASVKTAATSCGFSDPFYFSKVFKKNCGIAPSQFRDSPEEDSAPVPHTPPPV